MQPNPRMTRDLETAPAPLAGERGVTIVEMLVAVMLLAFVALGAVSLLITVLHQNKLASHRSLATHLASERIELLTSQRWSATGAEYQIPGEVMDTGPPVILTSDYGTLDGYPEFRRVLTLNYGAPYAGMLHVTAEVTWNDLLQGEKRHTMTTFVHPGLEQGI